MRLKVKRKNEGIEEKEAKMEHQKLVKKKMVSDRHIVKWIREIQAH